MERRLERLHYSDQLEQDTLIKDIDELIKYLDDPDRDEPVILNQDEINLIIDALVFYKEMNTH